MPLWNTPQSGWNTQYPGLNCVMLSVGDDYALLDGTENVSSGSKSVHFNRGSMGNTDAGTTFEVTGCSGGSAVTIQASNGVSQSVTSGTPLVTQTPTNLDASFVDLPGGALTGNGWYTDQGKATYYRAVVVSLVAGDVPVVIAKR